MRGRPRFSRTTGRGRSAPGKASRAGGARRSGGRRKGRGTRRRVRRPSPKLRCARESFASRPPRCRRGPAARPAGVRAWHPAAGEGPSVRNEARCAAPARALPGGPTRPGRPRTGSPGCRGSARAWISAAPLLPRRSAWPGLRWLRLRVRPCRGRTRRWQSPAPLCQAGFPFRRARSGRRRTSLWRGNPGRREGGLPQRFRPPAGMRKRSGHPIVREGAARRRRGRFHSPAGRIPPRFSFPLARHWERRSD